jgi:hypothetical protein
MNIFLEDGLLFKIDGIGKIKSRKKSFGRKILKIVRLLMERYFVT